MYSLGSISLVVYEKIFSEKKIEMWKVYEAGTQSDDNSSHDPIGSGELKSAHKIRANDNTM